MIKRDSRGHSYFIARDEILGFMKDELLRKHLSRMFSLIKNESWGSGYQAIKEEKEIQGMLPSDKGITKKEIHIL